jgi:hypothetical protein
LGGWAESQTAIQEFADEVGLVPGIVVGPLQQRKFQNSKLNFPRRFDFDLPKPTELRPRRVKTASNGLHDFFDTNSATSNRQLRESSSDIGQLFHSRFPPG